MFARLKPSANPSSNRFRNLSIYATGPGDCGRGRGGCLNFKDCGRGRGGRGGKVRIVHGRESCVGGSGAYESVIDILDVTCYFEDA